MRPDSDEAIDLERFELRLLPADPPPAADIAVEERRLPYEPTVGALSPALVRVVERYGLHERPLVVPCDEQDEEEYQVLSGSLWIRAAREAGLDRIPVRALELPDVSAAFLALVLNQQWAADVAAQADALQVLLEAGLDEAELARSSGLGRGRLRRLASLLELHPALRQALRAGRLRPQVAFGAAALSPASQEELAAVYEEAGELTGADLRRFGEVPGDTGGADGDDEAALAAAARALMAADPLAEGTPAGGAAVPGDAVPGGGPPDAAAEPRAALRAMSGRPREEPAARARRQAEELLRTLEQAPVPADLRRRVAAVVEELARITV